MSELLPATKGRADLGQNILFLRFFPVILRCFSSTENAGTFFHFLLEDSFQNDQQSYGHWDLNYKTSPLMPFHQRFSLLFDVLWMTTRQTVHENLSPLQWNDTYSEVSNLNDIWRFTLLVSSRRIYSSNLKKLAIHHIVNMEKAVLWNSLNKKMEKLCFSVIGYDISSQLDYGWGKTMLFPSLRTRLLQCCNSSL